MRLDSPLALALAGTVAVHLIVITVGDALIVTHPFVPEPPAPHVEMFDIEPPAPLPDPPKAVEPEPPKPDVPDPEPVKPVAQPQPQARALQPRPSTPPPEDTPPPPPSTDPQPASGGDDVVRMDDIAPGAVGNVPVAPGKNPGHIGRGGSGGGTGSGTGSGSGGEAKPVEPPTSIAEIKTPAKPKGDFSYFDAKRDYPAEARQLGIEGVIKVVLFVDDKGAVYKTQLLTKLGHGLDELALARAAKITFTPAIDTANNPTRSRVVWTFTMTLPQ